MTQDCLWFLVDRLTQAPTASVLAVAAAYRPPHPKDEKNCVAHTEQTLQSLVAQEGSAEVQALYEAAEKTNATWRRFIADETRAKGGTYKSTDNKANFLHERLDEHGVLALTRRTLHALLQYEANDRAKGTNTRRAYEERGSSTRRVQRTRKSRSAGRSLLLTVQMAAHALTPLVHRYSAEVDAMRRTTAAQTDTSTTTAAVMEDMPGRTVYARCYYAVLPLLMRLLLHSMTRDSQGCDDDDDDGRVYSTARVCKRQYASCATTSAPMQRQQDEHRADDHMTKASKARSARALRLWQAYTHEITQANNNNNTTYIVTHLHTLLQPFVHEAVRPMATALRFHFRRGQPTAPWAAPQHFFHFLRDAFVSVADHVARSLSYVDTQKEEEDTKEDAEQGETCAMLHTFAQLALIDVAIPVFTECYMTTSKAAAVGEEQEKEEEKNTTKPSTLHKRHTSSSSSADNNTAAAATTGPSVAASTASGHSMVVVNAFMDWVQEMMTMTQKHAHHEVSLTVLALAQRAWLHNDDDDDSNSKDEVMAVYGEAMAECALAAMRSGRAMLWRRRVLQRPAAQLCCPNCLCLAEQYTSCTSTECVFGTSSSSTRSSAPSLYSCCTCGTDGGGTLALLHWLLPTRHFLRSLEAGLRRMSNSLVVLDATLVPCVWASAVEPALRGFLLEAAAGITSLASTYTQTTAAAAHISSNNSTTTFIQLPCSVEEAMRVGTRYVWLHYCAACALHLVLRAAEDWRGMLLDAWQQARAVLDNTLEDGSITLKEYTSTKISAPPSLSCELLDKLARQHDHCVRDAVAHLSRLVELICNNNGSSTRSRSASCDEKDERRTRGVQENDEETETYNMEEDAMQWGLHTLEALLCALQQSTARVMSEEEMDGPLRRSLSAALETSLQAGLTRTQRTYWQRWAARIQLTRVAALLSSVNDG